MVPSDFPEKVAVNKFIIVKFEANVRLEGIEIIEVVFLMDSEELNSTIFDIWKGEEGFADFLLISYSVRSDDSPLAKLDSWFPEKLERVPFREVCCL